MFKQSLTPNADLQNHKKNFKNVSCYIILTNIYEIFLHKTYKHLCKYFPKHGFDLHLLILMGQFAL